MSYETMADERIPCPCGKGYLRYYMCENENFRQLSEMTLHCATCAEKYYVEREEKSPDAETAYYLTPLGKSIHAGAITESIRIPTPNDLDKKPEETEAYRKKCVLCKE